MLSAADDQSANRPDHNDQAKSDAELIVRRKPFCFS